MKVHVVWLFTVINLILLLSVAGASAQGSSANSPGIAPAAAVGTAFTYQGQLKNGSTTVNGSCDFKFGLWDDASVGNQVGFQSVNGVALSEGRFTVQLDFGAKFNGDTRWLEVAVSCPSGSAFSTLTPRQALTAAPYALRATSAGSVDVPLNLSGSSANPIISSTNSGTGRAGFFSNAGTIAALRGQSTGTDSTGVYGEADNGASARGVWGYTTSGIGTVGQSEGTDGIGVLGLAPNGTRAYAVRGINDNGIIWRPGGPAGVAGSSGNSYGVAGISDTNIGVYGSTHSSSGYAGYFNGNVLVNGTFDAISATARVKMFKIDHPLDPANKYLYHTSVESSDMKNIYDGVATLDTNGAAIVTLPDWFEALNQDFRYQITAIGAPGPNLYIAEEIKGNRFTIAGGKSGMRVSWQVTGVRHDPYAVKNPVQVEVDKSPQEHGKYLYPEGYGQLETKRVGYTSDSSDAQSPKKAPAKSTEP